MIFRVCILLFFLSSQIGFAQQKSDFSFEQAEEKLAQLANRIITDSLLEDRLSAYEAFETSLIATLQEPGSFDYPFKAIEAVSIQTADTTFRIFTWQLFVDNTTYKYGGLLQKNTNENNLFPLTDTSDEIAPYDIEYEELSAEEWYGALYYNMIPFDTVEQKYLLFGYDGFEFFQKRKIAEVLSFDESGTPVFGAPVFSKQVEGYPATTKNRLYLEYDASIAVRLNYDYDMDIIIHDHLIQMKGQYKGQGMVNVPDGSYEGYYYEQGVWNYREKIFDFVSEEPPRAPSADQKETRDIFGKQRKKRMKN